jgi:hypothetical protein
LRECITPQLVDVPFAARATPQYLILGDLLERVARRPLPCWPREYAYTFIAAIRGLYLADAFSMAARAGCVIICVRRGFYC